MKFAEFYREKYNNINIDESDSVVSYTGFAEEYNALTKGVVIRDASDASLIRLDGDETFEFLHRISTNEINGLRENEKVNTLFTNEKGRIIDRTTLFRYKGYGLLLGSREAADLLQLWLEKYIIMEDIKVSSINDAYSTLEILGPQADSFMTLICGKAVDLLDEKRFLMLNVERTNMSIAKVPYYNGQYKYVMILPNDDFERMLGFMLNQNTIFDIKMVGNKAYDYFRIQKLIPESPAELNDLFNPHEAGIIDEVSFTKGCYIGQEVIARLDTYDKVQKKLSVVESNLNSVELPAELEDNSGKDAGYLTSLIENPEKGNFIGLAYVRKKYLENDEELSVVDSQTKIKIVETLD